MNAAAPLPRTDEAALLVAADGSAFAVDMWYVRLGRRGRLARVLRALVVHATTPAPRHPLTRDALLAAGWPGERMRRDSGLNRLRVAIATLRSLGLAAHIATTRAGFELRGPVAALEASGLDAASRARADAPVAQGQSLKLCPCGC